jgi:hypothetical protein
MEAAATAAVQVRAAAEVVVAEARRELTAERTPPVTAGAAMLR